jgi:dTDP-4-dehydrorhamnose 3,5-epimerase
MEIKPLRLSGTYEITLTPHVDERGYFVRLYDEKVVAEHGLQTRWVQDNQSRSTRAYTLRGMHFQRPPHAETKLVRVVAGSVMDAIVDLRKDSETYGQWDSIQLTADNFKMVYIPAGFAHGFCTLEPDTIVGYKVDNHYAPAFEGGLRWNDPTLNIPWPTSDPALSPRDREHDFFENFISPF